MGNMLYSPLQEERSNAQANVAALEEQVKALEEKLAAYAASDPERFSALCESGGALAWVSSYLLNV